MDATSKSTNDPSLRTVPLLHVGAQPAYELMALAPERLTEIIETGRRHYGRAVLQLGDDLAWRWLARNGNPYLDEIAGIRTRLGQPGAVMMNMSYEWSCSTGVAADPVGVGSRMLRTLDWPLDGIGRNVVVARQEGRAGRYYNVTWPGYVGVLTAMAPDRFSAAINQPPMRRSSSLFLLDWVGEHVAMWRRGGLPPAHLLRRVFDECRSFDEAKALIAETPLSTPAFFTLSGRTPDEGCVIERTETTAHVNDAPTCITNHWRGVTRPGYARGVDSEGRLASMSQIIDRAGDDFAWVVPPILNAQTRLAVVANAARGALQVEGWEEQGRATHPFSLAE